mmetsp:Transcript_5740/g.11172  ORF Transcript_5740/g.11172 Transcript_5740/m.11172 type:complete len:135 (-) Transcript_5740:701-1105(-)
MGTETELGRKVSISSRDDDDDDCRIIIFISTTTTTSCQVLFFFFFLLGDTTTRASDEQMIYIYIYIYINEKEAYDAGSSNNVLRHMTIQTLPANDTTHYYHITTFIRQSLRLPTTSREREREITSRARKISYSA